MLVQLQGLGLGGQGQEVDLPPEGLPGGGAAAQVLPEGLAQGLGLRLQAQGLAHLLEEGKGVGLAQALEGELQALAGEVLEGLFRRLEGVEEVVLATSMTVEGEATALYLAEELKKRGVRVTRPAYGLPVGGSLEYADEVTLGRALEGRRPV